MSRRRGVIDRLAVAHLDQHELDTAERLATLGLDVVFRVPTGQNTSDVNVNGLGAEFKSPVSPHRNTVIRHITAKRHKQGPRFVLDMSRSPMSFSKPARSRPRWFLDIVSTAFHRYWSSRSCPTAMC